MFPRAVRLSMNNVLLMPSSHWIRAKSEIWVQSQGEHSSNTSSDGQSSFGSVPPHLCMEMVVQEDVGCLEVEVQDRGVHAVEEVHAHRDLVNHLELFWPHQRVAGQEVVQRSVAHMLHHHSRGLTAHSIDSHNVLKFDFGYFGHLVNYFPGRKKVILNLKNMK